MSKILSQNKYVTKKKEKINVERRGTTSAKGGYGGGNIILSFLFSKFEIVDLHGCKIVTKQVEFHPISIIHDKYHHKLLTRGARVREQI